MPFQPEALCALLHVHRIGSGKITFGKTEVMNGIQQIGFAHTVATADADNAFGKLVPLTAVILEL